jgi:RNA ligase
MSLLGILNTYHKQKYLIKQVHPTLPLTIWNYSQFTQYTKEWDLITLMCRGLVTDDLGNIVARPFKKFFNIEEGMHKATESFDVYEKMDGSLGIMFFYNNEWIFASRGSFTSDQAIMFKEIFESNHSTQYLNKDSTYMFEIIYPENRIVVDYNNFKGIVMLGEYNKTRYERDIAKYKDLGFNLPKKYNNIKDHTTLKNMVLKNAEGFVIKFSNGSRCKVKGDEYIRLHKIMTQLSTTSIWETLSSGDHMESLLSNVPDEFYDKIKSYENVLKTEYHDIFTKAYNDYSRIFKELGITSDKTFALTIKDNENKSLLFSIRNNKSISNAIWKSIKPKYKQL